MSPGAQPRLQSWGSNSLVWYYYPSTEKNRQVYTVWCSRLHNHILFIKKLGKKSEVRPNFGESGPPDPQWMRPWMSCWYNGQYIHRPKSIFIGGFDCIKHNMSTYLMHSWDRPHGQYKTVLSCRWWRVDCGQSWRQSSPQYIGDWTVLSSLVCSANEFANKSSSHPISRLQTTKHI